MCAYSNKCMPAPVEWWLILYDGSRLCSCCVHREVVPFFFFLSHILIDLVTKLQECSTRIRVFPLVLSTSPPTKLRQPSFSLSLFSSRAKRLRKIKSITSSFAIITLSLLWMQPFTLHFIFACDRVVGAGNKMV